MKRLIDFCFAATLYAVIAAFLYVASHGCAPLNAKTVAYPDPPNLSRLSSFGCSIQEITQPEGNRTWQLAVYAEYQHEDRWTKVFGIYPPSDDKKAWSDCQKWRKHIVKLKIKSSPVLQQY